MPQVELGYDRFDRVWLGARDTVNYLKGSTNDRLDAYDIIVDSILFGKEVKKRGLSWI